MQYRRDIDGLRGMALVAALCFHAHLPGFSGGYVGADVFFVISSYLITRIIQEERARGSFSFATFYERRARRLLPALFLVTFACLVAGWPLMSADAYENLGQSVVATTLFANNFLLMMTSGYWALESNFKPLLHTWSLGAEEQYYFVAPVLILALNRLSWKHMRLAIAVAGAVSFALCVWSVRHTQTANYYMLHTRIWELAVGTWIALRPQRPPPRYAGGLVAVGIILILGAVVFLPPDSYLSLLRVLPVIGTALIVSYGHLPGWGARLLNWPPLVWLGLISYSVYLWHQPLFAFLRVADPQTPPLWWYLPLLLASVALGWLSWRFVERPFRNRVKTSRKLIILILAPAAVLLIAAGAAIDYGGGLPWRFDTPPGADPPGTYAAYNDAVFKYKRDTFPPGPRPKLLVIGNSMGRDLINMADATGRFSAYDVVYRDDIDVCRLELMTPAEKRLVDEATMVVLAGHWILRECSGYAIATHPALHDKIVIVGPRDFGVNLNPYARLPLKERPTALVQVSKQALRMDARIRAMTPPNVYVNVIARLSKDGLHVPVFDEAGRILSEDRDHLTQSGARFIGPRVFADPVWAAVEATSRARAGLGPNQ